MKYPKLLRNFLFCLKQGKILSLVLVLVLAFFIECKADSSEVDIKVEAEIEKSGYIGEVFSYIVTLKSTSPDISNVKIVKNPSFPKDFTVIKGIAGNGRPQQIKEKGRTYYKWTIIRNFLIPNKEGKFSISDAELIAFLPHEKVVYHDFWGPRRMIEYKEVRLTVKDKDIKVMSLPKSNEQEFAGCIGEFTLDAWFPPGYISPGKEAYAVFTISGFGSLEHLSIPNLAKLFVKQCKLKKVDQDEEQSQKDGKLYNIVKLTCTFVPETDNFEILPLSLKFFNPKQGKYYTITSESLEWKGNSDGKTKGKTRNNVIDI